MDSFETKCIQAGYSPKNGEPRMAAIVQSTTFAYDTPEEMAEIFDLKTEGCVYSRLKNPTCQVLEKKVAELEGGVGALSAASGMAAITTAILNLCDSGDNFISVSSIYGGSYNLFNVTMRRLGIECRFVDLDDNDEVFEKMIDDKTKFIYFETIANPCGRVADFEKFDRLSKKYGIVLMIDNTIASPYICRPFEHGVHVVIHSTTKYLDGHGVAIGGIIVDSGTFNYLGNPRYPQYNTPDESYHGMVFARDCGKTAFIDRARAVGLRDLGGSMSPMNAFLTNLGTETLHLRMPRHSDNTLALAKAIEKHPAVLWVKYAGLENDSEHKKAMKYFYKGYCAGMLSFGIKGGREAAAKFQKDLKLFKIVTHVADSKSCALHPASTTHRQLSDADLVAAGVPVELIRLSVGIEGEQDIINDVVRALDKTLK
jgi:O-acetylhomoserine (thiol)-lyase